MTDANAIHDWFGLTYASYLVLPRSVMQSMPAEWQETMVKLLDECGDRLGQHYEANEYDVRLRVNGKFASDPLSGYRHNQLEPVAPKPTESVT